MDFDDYDSYAPIAPEPAAPPAGTWRTRAMARFRALPTWAQVTIGIVVGLLALTLAVAPFAGQREAGAVPTGTTVAPPVPTTTIARGVPPGDDTTVSRVIDGDTIEVAGGTRIRFIGIDTPETASTPGCYGLEATSETQRLLPAGQRVRLVYDVGRLDAFGRTLAYVYTLPEGRFVA